MSREKARSVAFRTLSQTGIHYRTSPLSQALGKLPKGAPQPGDRFPWMHLSFRPGDPREDLYEHIDDTKFNLLVFGQGVAIHEVHVPAELMCIHEIPGDHENVRELGRAAISGPAFYLLRPDGHVGLAGSRLDPAALRRWFASNHLLP
jgi:hypothetical protein